MNRRMVGAATDTLREVDVVVLVVDASIPPGAGDRFVLDLIRKVDGAVDPCAEQGGSRPQASAAAASSSAMRRPSVQGHRADLGADRRRRGRARGRDSGRAARGRAALPGGLPHGPDRTPARGGARPREGASRTRATSCRSATAVVIDQFEEPTAPGGITRIFASILVDHDSQKPIVVGKGGDMIKRIGTEARQDLEEMLEGRVYLDLHVKVRERWRDDERMLRELGIE